MTEATQPKKRQHLGILNELYQAASGMDWGQVVATGGPPCFHLENGRFCGRAGRWDGHKKAICHAYMPLDLLLAKVASIAKKEAEND